MAEAGESPTGGHELTISERRYFVGFEQYVRSHLAPTVRHGREVAPNPDCVRRILKDERPSRTMLTGIFRHAPALLDHPLTHPAVKAIYARWLESGAIPDEYGRGIPPKKAKDCVKED